MKQGSGVAVGTIVVCVLLLVGVAVPSGASAAGEQARLWQRCQSGLAAGQCHVPSGVAADPSSGAVYVVDLANNRINQFDVWGGFIKAFGWGVRTGAAELQTCTVQTGCQIGQEGAGKGQLSRPTGIGVDSEGDLYVVDRDNHRIEKFDPTAGPGGSQAEFILAFGGEVNKTKTEGGSSEAQRNLCTAASGDICQAGTVGAGSGQFGNWAPYSSALAVNSGDEVYVGDENRIQRFDSGGHYIESIALAGETVEALAIDNSLGPNAGNLYVTRCNPAVFCKQNINVAGAKSNVTKLSAAGAVLDTLTVPDPEALAVDAEGNVYVVDGIKRGESTKLKIHKFDPSGEEVPGFPFSDGIDASMGIAAGSACGILGADIYVTNFDDADSYVRAYGPRRTLCFVLRRKSHPK